MLWNVLLGGGRWGNRRSDEGIRPSDSWERIERNNRQRQFRDSRFSHEKDYLPLGLRAHNQVASPACTISSLGCARTVLFSWSSGL
jgi:hypothetical protein